MRGGGPVGWADSCEFDGGFYVVFFLLLNLIRFQFMLTNKYLIYHLHFPLTVNWLSNLTALCFSPRRRSVLLALAWGRFLSVLRVLAH